ncbi:hypothetical protein TNCV_1329331 [Trichonephila clavipes]|nr:hypothetical protein TNCV_1329331 [Trichonephila clavipes]
MAARAVGFKIVCVTYARPMGRQLLRRGWSRLEKVSLGSSLGSCLSKSSLMEAPVDDQSITMEDLGPPTPKLPADLRCSQITSIGKELEIYQIRRDYVTSMIDLENRTPSATTETKSKLEEELKSLNENILSWKVS